MTKAEAKKIAKDMVVQRARELIAAHDKSHDAVKQPDRGPINGLKYAMNYGELNSLREAVITLDQF